ncbi:hypothetical protein RGQ15_19765 [Paracoccus sp. MBLB3053]|uniref:DUF2993 domain-containing protein n=1 Tax=Paracoccus aurantius TaxID=3073814 RepID=A0ABU2HZ53_9RHOB|nr:hypothetical protein [Paracoccus sp. MBLB3053]MDS9469800.1 hypothetical protein [Paracoccus sp. MBLB3053]
MPDPQTLTARLLDPQLLEQLGAALRRRISVNSIAAAAGRAASVEIDRIEVGEASIEKVAIEHFSSRVTCGAALLRNVRAILELHFEVQWSYDLKWFGSDQGVKALGSKAKTIPLHDIRIPLLRDIELEVPSVDVSDVSASVQPVSDVALGAAGFTDLAIEQTRLPASGFRVSGLGFASFEVARFAAPDADSARLAIDRFSPEAPLRLPDVAVGNIEIPEVAIPDVGSPEPVTLMDIEPETFEAPVFKIGEFFKAIFIAKPVLHLQIGELVLSDLRAKASIGAVRVEGLSTPVSVEGLRLSGLTLDQVSAEGIRV